MEEKTALERLSESDWYWVGRNAALAYERDHKWLFRRVESIEFVDRRSVRRTVLVDFEVPRKLRSLHKQKIGPKNKKKKVGPKNTFLVPIATQQKWPPTMDFKLEDASGNKISRYRSKTTKRLDFGLLMSLIDLALTERGTEERKQWKKHQKGKQWKVRSSVPSAEISDDLKQELAEIVDEPQPLQEKVTEVVNKLSAELEEKRPPEEKQWQQPKHSGDLVVAAVDLAARLAGASLLWVAVPGPRNTDRIVTFSYQGAYRIKSPEFDEGKHPKDKRMNLFQRALGIPKYVATICSWRGRTLVIPLPHGGHGTRYHLNVHSPPGSVEMQEATALVLPAAPDHLRQGPERGPEDDSLPRSLSVAALAKNYSKDGYSGFLKHPDEWIGPESSGYLMDYGEPTVLATTNHDVAEKSAEARPADASAEIIDRQAHVYSGANGAPSHRLLLQLRLKASREGLINGCLIAAFAIASLMWAIHLWLDEAIENIGQTVVLLSLVPAVLAYVVVRPNEQPFEHEHLWGVRTMAVIAAGLPLVGAASMVVVPKHEDPPILESIWSGLAILSLVLLLGLSLSWLLSASPKKPAEPAADGERPYSP